MDISFKGYTPTIHNVARCLLSGMLPLLSLLLITTSCDRELKTNHAYGFSISEMPYPREIAEKETIEIRYNLVPEAYYADTHYTLRFFAYKGIGELRIGGSDEVLLPNDKYAIPNGAFRLYYTSLSSSNHELLLTFDDTNGNHINKEIKLNNKQSNQ